MNAVAGALGQAPNHEAIDAWRSVGVSDRIPLAVTTLKGPARKSAVYRLAGAGPVGETIVAKRCRTETATTEFAVYTQILPALPVTRLRCFGMTDAATADESWLFVEDADDEPFRAAELGHRALAAAWMAAVHATPAPAGLRLLPDRRVEYFGAMLTRAIAALRVALDNRSLTRLDRDAVAAALRGCHTVLGRWQDVADLCAALPDTLVHGGFGRKNTRVGRQRAGLELLVFDWECAGQGMPAIDLARVDPTTYVEASARHGRAVDALAAWRLVHVGRALWCISSIPGEADTLASPWAARAIGKVDAYAGELADVSRALGWAD